MSNGFIQFGDGEPIPVTNVEWTLKREPAPDYLRLPLLSEFEVTLPLPPETAARICRIVGEDGVADRIEIAAHPDLAELDVQMDGYYDGLEG